MQETELRRIERDLHDGAQARLVALGMSLGMAEQKLAERTRGARPSCWPRPASAPRRRCASCATSPAGSIRPCSPTAGSTPRVRALGGRLADLGDGLGDTCPERPKPPVESAAYFVVAEALANAGKHAGARRVDIRIVSGDGVLLGRGRTTTAAAAPTPRAAA